MMTALLLSIAWMLTAGVLLTLFAATKNADRLAEARLAEATVPQRHARRRQAA